MFSDQPHCATVLEPIIDLALEIIDAEQLHNDILKGLQHDMFAQKILSHSSRFPLHFPSRHLINHHMPSGNACISAYCCSVAGCDAFTLQGRMAGQVTGWQIGLIIWSSSMSLPQISNSLFE